jgi:predicted transposase YdaD
MGNRDKTTKEAVKAITFDIATYILKLDIGEDIEFVDKELLRIEKREADIVALCTIGGSKAILHLEIQNNNDSTMCKRMLRYYVDIKFRFDNIPIYQYLIYIGKAELSMKGAIHDAFLKYTYTIVDMHHIDCEEFIKLDTPDALVLSILCDFKDKDELDVLLYLTKRLQKLTKNDHTLGKYMLILETLSQNRDLKDTLKEVEKMLREIKYEELPSYEIGIEKGMERGICALYKTGQSYENIAKLMDVPIDKVQRIINLIKQDKNELSVVQR